jgi:T4 superinfection immunity protein
MELLFLLLTVLAIASGTAFYFLPAIVAGARRARHFGGIFIIDLLFGWTVIGWLGTLIWACADEPEKVAGRVPCPYCAEAILPAAKVCPHCRKDLPESFTAARTAGVRDPLAPITRDSPIPSLIVLVIFLILLAGALYYRHVRFERNSPSFVSDSAIVLADFKNPAEPDSRKRT